MEVEISEIVYNWKYFLEILKNLINLRKV